MNTKHTILILGSAPADTESPKLTEEYDAIESELRKSDRRDDFDLRLGCEVEAANLPGLIMRHRPEILHFIAHGSDEGELLFQGPDGTSQPASRETIASVFGVLAGTVRCVVLNACYSESQAKLIAEHVDVVIGMRSEVLERSAIAFAAGFYEALGYGRSFAQAFDLAKLQIDLKVLPDIDQPVMHVRDGIDAKTVGLPEIVLEILPSTPTETVGLPEIAGAPNEGGAVASGDEGGSPSTPPAPEPASEPIPQFHAKTWAVGAALLVSSVLVFIFAPDRLPDYKLEMIRHLVALVAGIGVAFVSGYLTVRMNSGGWAIQAGGGFAAWVITLLTWGTPPGVENSGENDTSAVVDPGIKGDLPPGNKVPEQRSEPEELGAEVDRADTGAPDESGSDDESGTSEVANTDTGDKRPRPEPEAKETWTVMNVRSVSEGDNKRIELRGPPLPASGILRLSMPVSDDRRFASDVKCRISRGPPPWCMLFEKPGNDGLRAGDEFELVGDQP